MKRKKIKKLFRYRKIPSLLKTVDPDKRDPLKEELYRLQEAIYKLDAYLESNWSLKSHKLKSLWKPIVKRLEHMGFGQDQIEKLTQGIRRYQLHETQIREGKLPGRLDPEYYYYYKSCDVRLIREVILHHADSAFSHLTTADWRYYDLVTEINDDIEDFFEDLETINGNLFLIQTWQHGIDKSYENFIDLLDGILIKSIQRHPQSHDLHTRKIKQQTFSRYVETRQLLRRIFKKIKKKGVGKDVIMYRVLEKVASGQ